MSDSAKPSPTDEAFNTAVLNSVAAQIAVLDRSGVIVAVNEAWRRFSLENSPTPGRPTPNTEVGTNYLTICQVDDPAHGEGKAALEGIRAVLAGDLGSFSLEYPCHSPTKERWFSMNVTPLGDARGGVVVAHTNITERRLAESALLRSNHEKEGLLKEIHHRVKNNLQVITSLLRLETARTKEPATRSVLKEMQSRVLAMALLHETLYRTGTFGRVRIADYLRQLGSQILRAQGKVAGDIRLTFDLSEVELDIDQSIPCGLIVTELLTNSLKHAFADGASGEVILSLRQTDKNGLILQVSDSGPGLPPDFDEKRRHSLGLELVSDLAGQLGGRLTVTPGPPPIFSITIDTTRRPSTAEFKRPV